jgi:isocitrate/isopropylmalate dehydrogenase
MQRRFADGADQLTDVRLLGEYDAATRLGNAIAKVVRENRVGTYDVSFGNPTMEVDEEVATNL